MNDEQRTHLKREVEHASTLIDGEPTFDTLADAAEVLCRAANRLAPLGHSVSLDRKQSFDLSDLEIRERVGTTREAL